MALDGLTETGESSVTVEERLFDGSATLVAVTVIDRWLPRMVGAVYKPDVPIVPTLGLMVQVTAVIVFWFTWAVNCWVWPAFRLADCGLMDIVNALKATVAETVLVGSAALGTALGAVYRPAEMEPVPLGLMDQFTFALVDF